MVACRARGAQDETAAFQDSTSSSAVADGPHAVLFGNRVAEWKFDREDDRNYDDWPDAWKRRYGRRYPRYIAVGLKPHYSEIERRLRGFDAAALPVWERLRTAAPSVPPVLPFVSPAISSALSVVAERLPPLPPASTDLLVDRYVRVDLDGGGAMLQSQPVAVSRMYGYALSAAIRTEKLQWDDCWAEMVYLDSDGQALETVKTPVLGETRAWKYVRTEVTGPRAEAVSVVIRLRVEPRGNREDIRGWAGFDNVALHRYPQLQLTGDHRNGLYPVNAEPVILATALGLSDRRTSIRFSLRDVHGNEKLHRTMPVSMESDPSHPGVYAGDAEWKLPQLPAGFYRIVASLRATDQTSLDADLTLGVLERFEENATPFGWTFPEGAGPIPLNDLPRLLSDCHVGWLKYSCWTAPTDLKAADQVAWLMAHVQERGIEAVGLLDQPPIGVDENIDRRTDVPIAHVLRDRELWQPLLEPLMSRLTLKVRRWQLGRERDFSFLSGSGLTETLSQLGADLQGYGPPLELAISWPWLEQQPPTDAVSWSTVVRSDGIPLTAEALDEYLRQTASEAATRGAKNQWLLLDPLPESEYSLVDRVRDLVFRMATVRSHDVSAAFVGDPFDPETGLLQKDGSPDAMLLPWRTTSAVIGSLRKVGSLQLPSGSSNMVFSDGKRSVMMVWSETTKAETLYLGDDVQTIDVWGHRSSVPSVTFQNQVRQQIDVDRTPKFVVGLDPLVTRFRMGVHLASRSIDSYLGREQSIQVLIENPTVMPLSGDVRLDAEDAWEVSPYPTPWQAKPGEIEQTTLGVTLRTNATTGDERLKLNFSLHTVPTRNFTVYRDLHVGPIGLEVDVTTRIDAQGNLVVRLEMDNKDPIPVRYDCRVFPAGRQYQRRFITIPGGETVQREFVLSDGEKLLGTTLLLRASEEGGRRVLNYTVQAAR